MTPLNKALPLDKSLFYYLATPYSKYPAGQCAAFEDAASVTGELLRRGYTVFSPITHGHPASVQASLDASDHDFWLDLDMRMIDRLDALCVPLMPGWRESLGVSMEISYAKTTGKPVFWLNLRNYRALNREPEGPSQ